jgi:hypothetical protein
MYDICSLISTIKYSKSQSETMFLKILATTNHYIGGRRTRGPLSYHDIALSHKYYATALFFFLRIKEELWLMFP